MQPCFLPLLATMNDAIALFEAGVVGGDNTCESRFPFVYVRSRRRCLQIGPS